MNEEAFHRGSGGDVLKFKQTAAALTPLVVILCDQQAGGIADPCAGKLTLGWAGNAMLY